MASSKTSFKPLQVLRTLVEQRRGNIRLSKGTRVVVVHFKDGVIEARVQDSAKSPEAQKLRLQLTPSQVERTFRGRPKIEA